MSLIHRQLKIGPKIIPLFPTQISFAFIYVWTSVIWKSQPLARKMVSCPLWSCITARYTTSVWTL